MKNEIAKRKKRFLAISIILTLLLCNLTPFTVFAETYTNFQLTSEPMYEPDKQNLVNTGDILQLFGGKNPQTYNGNYAIQYLDTNESPLHLELAPEANRYNETDWYYETQVLDYSSAEGTAIPAEQFKCWQVTYLYVSAGWSGEITLKAIPYSEFAITYELDGGINSPANPSVYYEGKADIPLENATKSGYSFDGWYTDAAFSTQVTAISAEQTGDVTLYAKFTPNPVVSSITYVLDGGSNGEGNPDSYTEGSGVPSFSDASKSGYSFDGWFSDASFTNKVTSISPEQTGDVTLYAKFTFIPVVSSITYVLDGGSNGEGNPDSYTEGTGVPSFSDASKSGYSFDGWFSDSTFTNKVTSISPEQTGDVTLYAKFTFIPVVSSITYVLDGGSNGEGNPDSYTEGSGVPSFSDASKSGYSFDGWFSDASFTNKVTSISPEQTGDVTLYAKFTFIPVVSSITYVLDGGSNGEGNPDSYTEGTGVPSFSDASKSGYSFDGWFSDSTFTNKVTSISPEQTGDVTLYAKFTFIPVVSSITYVLDGGSNGEGNPDSYTEGTGVPSFSDASKSGYSFDGWFSDSTFTNKVTSISPEQTGDVTLYAKFTFIPVVSSITYVLDGGSNGEGNPDSYTEGTGVPSFSDASKSGYSFDGWFSDASFTNKVTSISPEQTGDVTLYAKFTFIPVVSSITYVLDGGSNGEGNPDSYTEGTGVPSFSDASKSGYSFDGWFSDSTFTNKVTSISPEQTGDVTLYAKFTFIPVVSSITYVLDGGSNGEGNPDSYTEGSGVPSFSDASKSGYSFDGWFSDASFTNKVTSILPEQTGDVILYAKFTFIPVVSSITYVLDGGSNGEGNPDSYTEGSGVPSFSDASKSGYSFDGWFSDASFTNKVTSISPEQTGDVTLYAKFTFIPVVSSITYVLDGGSNGEGNPDSYTEGSGVPSFSDASKSGYSFDGWFSDASFTNKVTSISPEQTGDVTLFAKFTFIPVVSSITYVLDGGSNGEGNPESYTEGSGVPSFSDASKSGYSFDGWFSDASFTNKVTSISPEQTGDVTLYAKFTFIPVVSSITYVLDGGSNGEGNPDSYTEGTGVPFFSDASKSGYSFDGWFSDASFTNKVTSISPEQTGDVTLYAKFTFIPVVSSITYMLDGGSNGEGNPDSYTEGSGVPSFSDASKSGYSFDGWFSDSTFTNKVTSISPEQTGDVTLYAKFTLIPLPTQNLTQTPPPVPTQTPTSVPTQTPTSVPTQTPTSVPTQTPTPVPTQTPTSVPTQTPPPIPTQTPTPVPTQTLTPVSTQTPTSVPTQTPIPAEQKENSYPPKTADRTPIIPLLFIMGISSTVAMMTILLRRKREK